MARQQFYQPHRPHREDESNGGVYDPEETLPGAAGGQSGDISRGAQGTLDNIDDVLGAQEGLFNKDGDKDSTASLSDKERSGDNSPDYGPSALDDIKSKLGKGYSNDDKKTLLSRAFNGKSKLKKRAAIAGAVAAGGLGASMLVFFLMLPLKIESIINNLDNQFGAASSQAIDTESRNMFKQYVKKYIVPNLGKGSCHSTVDAGCVSVVEGTSPVSKMYQAWRQDRLEQKLATRYNLSIGKSGNNYYINDSGKRIIFGDKESDVFSDNHTTVGQRHEIENIISKRLKEGTLWDRVYYRFKLAPLLNKKFGVRHCINACKPINKFTDSVSTKKKAAKAYIVERVISPLSESYGLILQCLMEGNGCGTNLEKANAGDSTRNSEISSRLQTQLDAYAAKEGVKPLSELVKISDDIGKDGFQQVVAKALAQKIGSIFGKDVSGEAASKAVPVVGWVLMIAKVIHTLQTIGPAIRYISYAANAAGAVQIYTTYQVVASEAKSGQIDATQLGSFNSALSTNLSGSTDDRSDATQTPLYQSLMSSSAPSSSQTALLGGGLEGTASALTANPSGYKCDNKEPVPGGQVVCEEEKLDRGNGTANEISGSMNSITGKIPGFNGLVKAINFAGSIFGSAFGAVFQKGCDTVGRPFGCHAAMDWIGGQTATFMTFLVKKLVATPITDNMSGGRIFDMMAAGADVSHNSSCQENLGCAQISDQQAATIQRQYLAQQQEDFSQRPLFARMFSTDTPYSLVSRLALTMPGNSSIAGNDLISLMSSNPLSRLGGVASSLLPLHRASADVNTTDPFGVPQAGYNQSDIPTDPEGFFEQHCMGGTGPDQEGVYDAATNTLDTSAWQNDDANVKQDESTGQAVYIHPNKCQLIFSSLQSAGGLADPSLLPQDSLSGDQGSTSTSDFTVASYNMCQETNHPDCRYPGKAETISSYIETKSFDIIGAQEVSQPTQAGVLGKLSGYDTFPKQVPANQGRAIFWNTATFTLADSGRLADIYSNDGNLINSAQSPYAFPWVELTTVAGQKVFVISSHSPNNNYADAAGKRAHNARAILQWAKQHAQGNNVVIVTGDFNNSGTRDGSNSPYCVLTSDGSLQHAHDMQDGHNPSKDCPTPNPVHYAPLDSIYASTNASLTASGWQWMGEGGTNSGTTGTDHGPAYVTFSGLTTTDASGSSNDWQWPVNKKWWDSYKSDFLDAHTLISGTFTSPYAKGVADDISTPPIGSPEYSIVSGKVIKTNLCGAGDGMMIESNIQGGTLDIAYGHGTSPRFKVGDTVQAGQQILSLNGVGCKVFGAHLHVDMSFNGKHICPQDIFLAMGSNQTPNLASLTAKGIAPCGR